MSCEEYLAAFYRNIKLNNSPTCSSEELLITVIQNSPWSKILVLYPTFCKDDEKFIPKVSISSCTYWAERFCFAALLKKVNNVLVIFFNGFRLAPCSCANDSRSVWNCSPSADPVRKCSTKSTKWLNPSWLNLFKALTSVNIWFPGDSFVKWNDKSAAILLICFSCVSIVIGFFERKIFANTARFPGSGRVVAIELSGQICGPTVFDRDI